MQLWHLECLFKEDMPGVGSHAFLILKRLVLSREHFSPDVVFLHPMFVHDQG